MEMAFSMEEPLELGICKQMFGCRFRENTNRLSMKKFLLMCGLCLMRIASWCFGQCLTTSLCCFNLLAISLWGLPGCLSNKESACQAGDMGSIPGLKRSPGEGTGKLLQDFCLVNPKDRGAWWATIHSESSDPSGFRVLASTAERRNSSECQPNAWLVLLRMPLDGDSAMEKCYKIFPNSVTATD